MRPGANRGAWKECLALLPPGPDAVHTLPPPRPADGTSAFAGLPRAATKANALPTRRPAGHRTGHRPPGQPHGRAGRCRYRRRWAGTGRPRRLAADLAALRRWQRARPARAARPADGRPGRTVRADHLAVRSFVVPHGR